jgi:oxygen-dependent protoporphyrinogen oxidase
MGDVAGKGNPERPVVAVIGGGIAGLAAAVRLSDDFGGPGEPAGIRVILLESAPELGGKLRAATVGAVTVDVGAESLLASRPEAVDFAHAVGLESQLEAPAVSAPGLVLPGGVVRALPPGLVMGIPGDVVGLRAADVLSDEAMALVAAEANREVPRIDSDVSLGRYIRGRLGDEVVERLVEPLLGGVYAGHSDELSLQACIPAVFAAVAQGSTLTGAAQDLVERSRLADLDDRAPSSRGGNRFVGIRGGVARLVESAAELLRSRGVELRTQSTVRELARASHGWRLTVGSAADPDHIDVDAVILATPALSASRLLHKIVSGVAQDIGEIEYASVAVVTYAFRRSDVAGVAGSSGLLVVPQPDRIVKASTFSSSKWAWLAQECAARDEPLVLLRGSIGRFGEQAVLQRDDDELAGLAEDELRPLIRARAGSVDHVVTRWAGSLPQYRVGHLQRVARIRRGVAALPGLAVVGAAYDGVGVAACVASGQSGAAHVAASLRYRAEPGHQ